MAAALPLPTALVFLDYFGIAVFAISGALLAAEKKQTLVTFIFFAVVTGTLLICIAAGLAVWLTSRRRFAGKALLWFDAAGMAAYATYGAAKALAYGVAPVPAFAMGVLTACTGGIIRDVLAGEPSVLMRPELYVTAAALSAGLLVGLALLGLGVWPAAGLAIAAGFGLRGAAIALGWSLPAYRD